MMNISSKLFKVTAARMPRVRGFGSRFYFGHPFLDAWFAWFPLNQVEDRMRERERNQGA